MLTRAQAAKRLGKSIATVRRLEGEQLHPRRDEAGIYRFDAAEVDRIASRRGLGRRPRASGLALGAASLGPKHQSRKAELQPPWVSSPLVTGSNEDAYPRLAADGDSTARATELNSLAARVGELEELWANRERAAKRVEDEADAQCALAAAEMFEALTSLSDRDLRRLERTVLDELIACLDALAASVHRVHR